MSDKLRDNKTDEFEMLDEYMSAVGSIHAPDKLKRDVINMASTKKKAAACKKMRLVVAAATVILFSLCFHRQIMAFADFVAYKSTYVIGKYNKKEFSGEMGYVQVNTLKAEALEHMYSTMEELEELMGVTLLKSDYAYIAPFPNISLHRNEQYDDYCNSVIYHIFDGGYYANNRELEDVWESGSLWHSIGEDAYTISYEATIYSNYGTQGGNEADINYNYEHGVYMEEYETAGGYRADIFVAGNEYNAVIFDRNIMYSFRAENLGTINKLDTFKEFLDTLKY